MIEHSEPAGMRYRISHRTTYAYGDVVPICHNEANLTPRSGPSQTLHQFELEIHPRPSALEDRLDYFGNLCTVFSIHEGHKKLQVSAVSIVTVMGRPELRTTTFPCWEQIVEPMDSSAPDQFLAMQFLYDSQAITRSSDLANYARPSFPAGRPILEGLLDLTGRVYREFRYDTRATNVKTRVEEVFRIRRGVCQDFAHLEIGCLRSLGIPARYVSGYLRTIPPPGGERLVGRDASHAWLSAYCGAAGWVDFDPTNNMIPGTDHITLAWGRDYFDVCPIKGIFVGGGDQTMNVEVDVMPVNQASQVR